MVAFRAVEERRHLRSQVAWFFAWVIVTAVGLALHPSKTGFGTHEQLGLPVCPSVALFDRPCLGCGLTTSFVATLHMDFVAAWQAHPFGPLFYLLFTASAFACLWGWTKRARFDTDSRAFSRAAMALTLVFVAFGVVRFATVRYHSREYAAVHALRLFSSGEEGRQTASVPEQHAPTDRP